MNNAHIRTAFAEDTPSARQRGLASFALSIAAHAAIIAAVVYFAAPPPPAHRDWVLAYMVEIGNGHAGAGAASPAALTSTSVGTLRLPTPHRVEASKPAPAKSHAISRQLAVSAEPSRVASREPEHHEGAAAPDDNGDAQPSNETIGAPALPSSGMQGSGGAQSHTGSGDGSGSATGSGSGVGDGIGDAAAHADYGSSPAPRYPASARRREQQGTVTLRVQVGADGAVGRVEIAESSGVEALDDAAAETVRSRWRFVPAHRGPVAFESWVLVPIRFALTEANAGRPGP